MNETSKNDISDSEEFITGTDPILVKLLRQVYSSLKKGNINPTNCVNEIEKVYNNKQSSDQTLLNGLDDLLNQAYELLHPDCRSWESNREELYAIFERIIFLKAREDVFKIFFNDMEELITSAMLLDFSKRVNAPKIITQEGNVFDYAASMINMLIEKMQESVVSANAVNIMLSTTPDTIIVVTDISGKIRFINRLAELLLGVQRYDFIDQPVNSLFLNYSSIEYELSNNGQLKDSSVYVKIGDTNYPALLTAKKAASSGREIKEIVYIIQLQKISAMEINN